MLLKNLVKIRKKKKLTQCQLAEKSGVSYNTIIKMERGGIKNPKIGTVIKLAKALSVKIDDIIN
jgi:transcriptional regulator with XRE-family HTH domain